MTYYTTQNITIPAGTPVVSPPARSSRWGKDYVALVQIGRDATGYFTVNIEAGLDSGIIAKAIIPSDGDTPDLIKAVEKHLNWMRKFLCDADEVGSTTPRKVAMNSEDAANELDAALNAQAGEAT